MRVTDFINILMSIPSGIRNKFFIDGSVSDECSTIYIYYVDNDYATDVWNSDDRCWNKKELIRLLGDDIADEICRN